MMFLNVQTESSWQQRLFWISHLFLITTVVLWINPVTFPVLQHWDFAIFKTLNDSLEARPFWQQFWGTLNHPLESKLTLIIAGIFNLWALHATKDPNRRKIRLKQTIYFWICFEIGWQLQNSIFHQLLHVVRDSPSLVLQPVIKLSTVLDNPLIKDSSSTSFPSAHAFSLTYWASFTALSSPKKVAIPGILFASFFCLPRLFGGAHWFSDVFFGTLLAFVWLSWVLNMPWYRWVTKPTPQSPRI